MYPNSVTFLAWNIIDFDAVVFADDDVHIYDDAGSKNNEQFLRKTYLK